MPLIRDPAVITAAKAAQCPGIATCKQELEACNNDKTAIQSLQPQLDGALKNSTNLSGQLDAALNNSTSLAGQLQTANQAKTDLTGQLQTANQTTAALTGQLQTANQTTADLTGQLQTANQAKTDLETTLNVTQLKFDYAKLLLPIPPISKEEMYKKICCFPKIETGKDCFNNADVPNSGIKLFVKMEASVIYDGNEANTTCAGHGKSIQLSGNDANNCTYQTTIILTGFTSTLVT